MDSSILQRSPPSPRGENRLKRGESFLIPREDRAALVFFINRNYEKNLAELLPGHPLREKGHRPRATLRKTVSTSEREGREGGTKGIRWRGSRQQLGKPVYGFSPLPSLPSSLFCSYQNRVVSYANFSRAFSNHRSRMNINSINSIKISVLQRESAIAGGESVGELQSPSPLFPGTRFN